VATRPRSTGIALSPFVVAHKGYESYSGRSALGAPQGYAPGQANDKEKGKHQKQKGDISNDVRKGTFLTSFDTQGDLRLTREDGCCTVWPKDKVEIGSSGGDTASRKDPLCETARSFSHWL
jgi:hypothetical protein